MTFRMERFIFKNHNIIPNSLICDQQRGCRHACVRIIQIKKNVLTRKLPLKIIDANSNNMRNYFAVGVFLFHIERNVQRDKFCFN